MDKYELAVEILAGTRDGEDLSPSHLSLVEGLLNFGLTEKGMELVLQIHADVKAGKYQKPWFHGVEHMSIDHEGYVYYKGVQVEHYEPSYAYSNEAKANTENLGKACVSLEQTKPLSDWKLWDAIDECARLFPDAA